MTGREHVGRFAQRGVLRVLEDVAEVAERLLVAQDVHAQRLGVGDQRRELLGRERAVRRADLGVLLEGELVLHVVGEQVQLQVRARARPRT